jgi:hypothetical protein
MYDALMNELVCLCEVRGELDAEGNARLEQRIAEIKKQLENLS